MPNPSGAAVAQLLQTERERSLRTRRVFGYPIWGIERFGWHERNLAGAQAAGPGAASSEDVGKRNHRILQSLKDLAHGGNVFGRDIWVLSSSQYRRKDAQGKQQCMFTGYLERQFGDRLLFLERNALGLPAHVADNVFFIDGLIEMIAGAASGVAPVASRFVGADVLEAFSPIGRKRLAKAGLMGQLWDVAAYGLVRALRPKAVFVLCGYTRFVPLQRVIKRLGIPLIELQHGIIHAAHAGYCFDAASAPDYVPDHIMVFGERFGQVLESCSGYWRGRWSVGGQPWLQACVNAADAQRSAELGAGAAAAQTNASGPVVVFTQPIEPVRRLLQRFLPELRRLLPPEIEIVLKPHPREPDVARGYHEAVSAGVKLEPTGSDSYQLLARCRASVCVFSTLALEALAFPCRSFVLHSELWPPELHEFVAAGVLEAAASASELVAKLQEPSPAAQRRDIARSLFGVGEPEPNYGALLQRLGA